MMVTDVATADTSSITGARLPACAGERHYNTVTVILEIFIQDFF